MTGQAAGNAMALPGYRRTIRVEPGPRSVCAMLEDDPHCMAVRLRHDGHDVTGVDALSERAPWAICPGAEAVLVQTFTGVPLDQVTARRDKQQNCTHLHDLAVLAAAHAHDARPSQWQLAASDPVDGERVLEISRDGRLLHRWRERDGVLAEPAAVAGLTLLTLREWIAGLDEEAREAARLLQWAGLVAHGRGMTDTQRRAALGQRPSCYAMQPERVADARETGTTREFSSGAAQPLEGLAERFAAARDGGDT